MQITRKKTLTLATIGALLLTGAAWAGTKTFIDSDDYDDGDEGVGLFLNDAEYSKMVEEIERNDTEFDWGWLDHSGKKANKVKDLGFSLSDYSSIRIAHVEYHAIDMYDGLEDTVIRSFSRSFQRFGLDIVNDPDGQADLDLQIAIVDLNTDRTYAYVTWIDPFVELEIRLVDNKTGNTLMLLRSQEHGSDPTAAIGGFAGDLYGFLR